MSAEIKYINNNKIIKYENASIGRMVGSVCAVLLLSYAFHSPRRLCAKRARSPVHIRSLYVPILWMQKKKTTKKNRAILHIFYVIIELAGSCPCCTHTHTHTMDHALGTLRALRALVARTFGGQKTKQKKIYDKRFMMTC